MLSYRCISGDCTRIIRNNISDGSMQLQNQKKETNKYNSYSNQGEKQELVENACNSV